MKPEYLHKYATFTIIKKKEFKLPFITFEFFQGPAYVIWGLVTLQILPVI